VSQTRRRFDPEFRAGAVRIVTESGRSIALVARELGVNEGTLGNWVARDRQGRGGADAPLSGSEREELQRLGQLESCRPPTFRGPATGVRDMPEVRADQ
jgi:transposase